MENDDWFVEERPRDAALDAALPRVLQIFEEFPLRVFYSTQIETRLEREIFHWITSKALLELSSGGKIQRVQEVVHGRTVHFYASVKHRYLRRELRRLVALLTRIFDSNFTQAIGVHAELMFDAALSRHGFRFTPERNIRAWNGRNWHQTNHNLDRVCERDGIAYGVEIKNSQGYIDRSELQTKLQLCAHLQLVPLFIMRFAPKTYINQINRAGGYAMLFEDQIYPFAHGDLLAQVREQLGLKVDCPRDIGEGNLLRLVNWHDRRLTTALGLD